MAEIWSIFLGLFLVLFFSVVVILAGRIGQLLFVAILRKNLDFSVLTASLSRLVKMGTNLVVAVSSIGLFKLPFQPCRFPDDPKRYRLTTADQKTLQFLALVFTLAPTLVLYDLVLQKKRIMETSPQWVLELSSMPVGSSAEQMTPKENTPSAPKTFPGLTDVPNMSQGVATPISEVTDPGLSVKTPETVAKPAAESPTSSGTASTPIPSSTESPQRPVETPETVVIPVAGPTTPSGTASTPIPSSTESPQRPVGTPETVVIPAAEPTTPSGTASTPVPSSTESPQRPVETPETVVIPAAESTTPSETAMPAPSASGQEPVQSKPVDPQAERVAFQTPNGIMEGTVELRKFGACLIQLDGGGKKWILEKDIISR